MIFSRLFETVRNVILRKEDDVYEIVDAEIKFVSLCRRGANKLGVLYKSDDDTVQMTAQVVKADMELGEVLAVVYAPDTKDAQGHFASAPVVRKMAHTFAQSGHQIDVVHDEKPLGRDKVFVAESFIVQKADPRFANYKDVNGKPVNTEGAWAVLLKIEDPDVRKLYREEGWNGVSLSGPAKLRRAVKKTVTPPEESAPMNEDQIKKLVTDTVSTAVTAAVAKAVTEALPSAIEKALKPAEPTTPAVKGYEGELTAEAVQKAIDEAAQKALRERLSKALADGKLDEARKIQKELAGEKSDETADGTPPTNQRNTSEPKKLNKSAEETRADLVKAATANFSVTRTKKA